MTRSGIALATLGWLALAASTCPAWALDRTELCLTCHLLPDADRLPQHPIDVPVAERGGRSPLLPLVQGRMTCVTCHTGHGPEGRHAADGGFFLREAVPGLCARCHRAENGLWDTPHALYADTIHGGERFAGVASAESADPRIQDAITRRCQACHEGASLATDFLGAIPPIEIDHTHPMPEYRPSMRNGSSLASDRSVSGYRLVEGRVSCGSCHRVYGANAMLLSRKTRRELCLTCHKLGAATEELGSVFASGGPASRR